MPSKAKPSAPATLLTPKQEAALTEEIVALGDNLLMFPGKAARRFAWSAKIQLAAERDADDLVRTPFDGEPEISLDEIHAQGRRVTFLRTLQSRWQAVVSGQKKAAADFEKPAAEAAPESEQAAPPPESAPEAAAAGS